MTRTGWVDSNKKLHKSLIPLNFIRFTSNPKIDYNTSVVEINEIEMKIKTVNDDWLLVLALATMVFCYIMRDISDSEFLGLDEVVCETVSE